MPLLLISTIALQGIKVDMTEEKLVVVNAR